MKGFSNKKVNKSGKVLAGISNDMPLDEAVKILNYFRSIHIHPMFLFRKNLDRKIKCLKKNAILSQRLKRAPSIIKKLKINKGMNLARMQDIGGLRVVLNNLEDLYNLKDLIRSSENQPGFKSTFVNEKDYIKNPKESGYRSYHLIYKYEKNLKNHELCRIEIQLRTKLHHSWATAVEVIGTYLRQPLKQSFGDKELLFLLKKISKAFVLIEEKRVDKQLFKEIKTEVENTKLLEKLNGFNVITDVLDQNQKRGKYFLITLDFKKRTLSIGRYSQSQLTIANENYSKIEKENLENSNIEVVLVSVDDIKKLKTLYPNYFLDTKEFVKNLNKVIKI